jgi:F0F1-type ATP synthase membrane subunit b/b'
MRLQRAVTGSEPRGERGGDCVPGRKKRQNEDVRVVRSKLPVITSLLCLGPAAPASAAGGLNLIPDPFLLVVNFTVLLLLIYPVNRLLLKPLAAVLAEREARTSGARERAERLSSESLAERASLEERSLAARAQAQARRAALLAEADSEARALIGAAREVGQRELEEVRAAVAEELASARDSLASEAKKLAREAASQILGRKL